MEIDYSRMKQIIVTDRPFGYKPDKATLRKLGQAFPDIQILGFGAYQQGYWCLVATSSYFPINIGIQSHGCVPIQEVLKWKPSNSPILSLVPPSI